MSERTGRNQEQEQGPRKARTRACDQCRRRKVRCNGSEEEGRTCSTCASYKEKCTYSTTNETRKTCQVDVEYLRALQCEVTRLRLLVQQLQAELLEKDRLISSYAPSTSTARDSSVKQEGFEGEVVLEGFASLNLSNPQHPRFMGRASNYPLVKAVIRMKHWISRGNNGRLPNVDDEAIVFEGRLPELRVHPSDYIVPDPPYTRFPDPLLMERLFSLYFVNIHPNLPILHRPTFLQDVASKFHLVDEVFGATVLLVCALGARFSYDYASLPPGAAHWQLCGWPWFEEVREKRKLMPLTPTTLRDVQVAVLATAYVATLGLVQAISPSVAYALRLCQNLGLHRRTTYGPTPSVENELRKRAFWCLLPLDAVVCDVLGRPCGIQEGEFDIEYPSECDDEYWLHEDNRQTFKQPSDIPSSMAYFNWYLRLIRIENRALCTVYSTKDAKELQDPEYVRQLVTDLDSELEEWFNALPDHLRYDPLRQDAPFAAQAASLNAAYHHIRIFVHRPLLIQACATSSPSPSSAICTNAAQLCIQAVATYYSLAGPVLVYQNYMGYLYAATLVLLLRVWQNALSETASHAVGEIEHIQKAMHLLESLEVHWHIAARYRDILRDLMAIEKPSEDVNAPSTHRYAYLPPEIRSLSRQASSAYTQGSAQATTPSAPYLNISAPHPSRDGGRAPSTSWAGVDHPPESFPTPDPDLDAIFAQVLPTGEYDSRATMPQQYISANPLASDDVGSATGLQQAYVEVYPTEWGPGVDNRAAQL